MESRWRTGGHEGGRSKGMKLIRGKLSGEKTSLCQVAVGVEAIREN